jgi:soluble lytic murein transglycosylase
MGVLRHDSLTDLRRGWVKTAQWFIVGVLLVGVGPGSASLGQTDGAKKPKATTSAAKKKKTTAKGTSRAGKRVATEKAAKPAGGAKGVRERMASAREAKMQRAAMAAQTLRLTNAFAASAQLRPMAQILASTRSPAAYTAVLNYAQSHPGAGAATAYLALGHAYAGDRRYVDSENSFRQSAQRDDSLSDYADYLGAQAAIEAGRGGDAYGLLDRFAERHPGSIFAGQVPVLLASAHLQQNDGAGAQRVLEPLLDTPAASRVDFQYELGRAYQMQGNVAKAGPLFRGIYKDNPMSSDAPDARAELQAMGTPLTAAERKVHADALFNANRYAEAAAEYNAIRNDRSLGPADRDALEIYSAVCSLKLKHLSRHDVEKLPVTNDDSAALKLYLFAEISRTEKNRAEHDGLIAQLVQKYPSSRWTEEALYSGGNMYLLTHDAEQAIYHYTLLVEHFPLSVYAPSAHWRAAWMNYRLRHYAEAARLMDEQIVRYGAGIEAPSALYWRGRILEDEEHNFSQAVNYYRALTNAYPNFYYAYLGRQRLAVLGTQAEVAPAPTLAYVRKLQVPQLTAAVPQSDPHVIKAKLLANAALNEYIGPEIQASPTAGQWGALAQAQIFTSYGEYTRALQSMKQSGISFFSLPENQVPMEYWRVVFPQPYWSDLVADSERNGLDPYLVASLIRQESEFNPGAVSYAHAYGLMQLLGSVGKENAKKEGLKGFQVSQLLNPSVNLELGTRNLKDVLNRFGGETEYALAAYNAGDVPVRQWMAQGDYKDIPEFVESIPYTQTRDYVQAIVRNREMYRTLYGSR